MTTIRSPGKECIVSSSCAKVERSSNYTYHHPLRSIYWCRSFSGIRVAGAGRQTLFVKVRPLQRVFKSVASKRFGFHASRRWQSANSVKIQGLLSCRSTIRLLYWVLSYRENWILVHLDCLLHIQSCKLPLLHRLCCWQRWKLVTFNFGSAARNRKTA